MLENLIENNFVLENERIAVGVSGGADSMLLLCALLEKQKQVPFFMEAIHVNHHLREKESDDDAKFVEGFCKKHKIPCKILDVDALALKKNKKKTLEESARILRYDAIKEEMKKENLSKLFLAHHKNDQAETILMNIFRGAGIDGASGIKNTKTILRPLLKLSKQEILETCEKERIRYVTDKTNFENDCTRNFIRNLVIPEIQKVYPNVVETVSAFGERCEEIQNFVESLVDENRIEVYKDCILLKTSIFDEKPFLVREYLKLAFEKLGIFADIEAKHYKLVMELPELPVGSSFDFPHGICAKKVYSGIKFIKKSAKNREIIEYPFVIGETEIDGFGKITTEFIRESGVNYGDENFYVDYYKVPTNAVWRHREFGDVFAKLGTGSKRLNDYFTDKKIDNDLRDDVIVLASENKILLVLGYDVGEVVKVDCNTEKIVKISFNKN